MVGWWWGLSNSLVRGEGGNNSATLAFSSYFSCAMFKLGADNKSLKNETLYGKEYIIYFFKDSQGIILFLFNLFEKSALKEFILSQIKWGMLPAYAYC